MSVKHHESFSPAALLESADLDRRIVELKPAQCFFTQGEMADTVFCLLQGHAKLTVVTQRGKQTTIMLLSSGDIFGEESLTMVTAQRMATATAVNTCTALSIKRGEMLRAMHKDPAFSDQFLSVLLVRSMRTQADLVDQKLNTSEQRLARALLLMTKRGKPDEPQILVPPVTQETLAEMIGTTRSRVSFFMNRFRDLGLINYKERIRVHKPRLEAALLDQFAEV
ncbi:MAG: Crp/Fnr family transcriptional regulator [Terracidiphilus sp.]|jgi:CRP-like cAMP-binding protein